MCVCEQESTLCVCVCVLVLITINLRFCLPFALASNLYANQSKFLIERNEKKEIEIKKNKIINKIANKQSKRKGKSNKRM